MKADFRISQRGNISNRLSANHSQKMSRAHEKQMRLSLHDLQPEDYHDDAMKRISSNTEYVSIPGIGGKLMHDVDKVDMPPKTSRDSNRKSDNPKMN